MSRKSRTAITPPSTRNSLHCHGGPRERLCRRGFHGRRSARRKSIEKNGGTPGVSRAGRHAHLETAGRWILLYVFADRAGAAMSLAAVFAGWKSLVTGRRASGWPRRPAAEA